ncbi:MAG: ribonuclease HI [Dehalococcoidia bacterium]|nr:ribonuclease HI [Dehalococcoidia bacterium]
MKTSRSLFSVNEVLKLYSSGPVTGIFTDGSCVGNPGPGGWGTVFVQDDKIIDQKFGHADDTTNNQMELTALLAALELTEEDSKISIYTDSQLLVNIFNKWASNWEAMGWKRKSGPIKNLELIKKIYILLQVRNGITILWIPAHSGYKWNEYADSLSTAYLRDVL